ncbi:hypothetical protein L596_024362 [Steinernema carpocapsae]|uniref:Secreted protein n=1 Tax=Steinernema carpocapsae TaxID=34508 RepID=A0A4U5MGT9_STECR|nr:hypothetical protein L596_024362 [Steinernema carpocapsae]
MLYMKCQLSVLCVLHLFTRFVDPNPRVLFVGINEQLRVVTTFSARGERGFSLRGAPCAQPGMTRQTRTIEIICSVAAVKCFSTMQQVNFLLSFRVLLSIANSWDSRVGSMRCCFGIFRRDVVRPLSPFRSNKNDFFRCKMLKLSYIYLSDCAMFVRLNV